MLLGAFFIKVEQSKIKRVTKIVLFVGANSKKRDERGKLFDLVTQCCGNFSRGTLYKQRISTTVTDMREMLFILVFSSLFLFDSGLERRASWLVALD